MYPLIFLLLCKARQTVGCSGCCLFCVNPDHVLSGSKYMAMELCVVCAERVRRYNNSPSMHDCQNEGCSHVGLQGGQKET